MLKTLRTVAFLVSCIIITGSVFAQNNDSERQRLRQQLFEKTAKMSAQELNDYYQNQFKRKPDIDLSDMEVIKVQKEVRNNKSSASLLPEDIVFPIESDEVQAILMTWPYIAYSSSGESISPFFTGVGMDNSRQLTPMIMIPDTSSNSSFISVFANLANSIQKHTQLWLTLANEEDTTVIKQYMANHGMPLTNCRYFFHQTNAFWFRDFGPMAFYYGDDDQIGFLDLEYYPGRPMDDSIPIRIAEDLGWPVYTTEIEYEGGNVLQDGLGSLFTTDAVYRDNMDTEGQYFLSNGQMRQYSKTALTKAQVDDSLRYILNSPNLTVVPALEYDGGTGHIDLYADMWEETGFVIAQYPDNLSSWGDAQKVESNKNTFISKQNHFGNNYDYVRIPLPKQDRNRWYSSPSEYNRYTRCFSNHTFVNDAIIQPVFYDSTASVALRGDKDGNINALNVMRRTYPGYTFEEIDARSFDGYGGAIHCITKQIPAENPVRIFHQPVRYFNTETNGSTINLEVLSQNKSGIETVKIYYKTASSGDWTEVVLATTDHNKFTCSIDLNADIDNDTLFYYISSTSNNGKTMIKPLTAHNGGFYTMPYGKQVTGYNNNFAYQTMNTPVKDLSNLATDTTTVRFNGSNHMQTPEAGLTEATQQEFSGFSEIYPNPAVNQATIRLNNSQTLNYRIVNLKGQMVQNGKIAKNTSDYTFDVQNIKDGVYWIILSDGNLSTSRKLIIAR